MKTIQNNGDGTFTLTQDARSMTIVAEPGSHELTEACAAFFTDD